MAVASGGVYGSGGGTEWRFGIIVSFFFNPGIIVSCFLLLLYYAFCTGFRSFSVSVLSLLLYLCDVDRFSVLALACVCKQIMFCCGQSSAFSRWFRARQCDFGLWRCFGASLGLWYLRFFVWDVSLGGLCFTLYLFLCCVWIVWLEFRPWLCIFDWSRRNYNMVTELKKKANSMVHPLYLSVPVHLLFKFIVK